MAVPPGWHPDPADPTSSLRWWDGTQWTAHTQPVANDGWSGPAAYGSSPLAYGGPVLAPTAGRRNQRSLTAIGVAALYVLLAISTHIVFFGIVPVMASVRAVQRKEPLAPLAIVAAVVAVTVAIASLAIR